MFGGRNAIHYLKTVYQRLQVLFSRRNVSASVSVNKTRKLVLWRVIRRIYQESFKLGGLFFIPSVCFLHFCSDTFVFGKKSIDWLLLQVPLLQTVFNSSNGRCIRSNIEFTVESL
ncbi:Hypothetical_protein [Hexamita inflata]|uniref:Hypothetical_protein n=1 Tax=Hexamita inflata TaxID=28002 RepID=A0AA86QBP4_9EUKA|nr:Hypothetical protein HINF_LOCUS43502 [Hexamita inflata]CAI9955860.1 Hypothetical protein HINF_LOCUS43505 [Hexamita inflata]